MGGCGQAAHPVVGLQPQAKRTRDWARLARCGMGRSRAGFQGVAVSRLATPPLQRKLNIAMPEVPNPVPPGADDLQRRRLEIGRGLRRSHYAVAAASGLFGLLALAALWLGGEARRRAEDAQAAQRLAETNAADAQGASMRLWEFSARAARQERLSRAVGQRTECLDIIREAVRFQPARELRDEALSALLLPDIGTNLVWRREAGFEVAGAYDTGFERFILNNDGGRAVVGRVSDGAVLMEGKGLGQSTPFGQFSPDGRLAAIAFSGGKIGVWDWRTTNLVMKLQGINAEFGRAPFDFSPDGRHLWLLTSATSLQEYAVETGRLERSLALARHAQSIRLSPSGRRVAIAAGNNLDVWDLDSRRPHSAVALTNRIWCLAWQPGEERLAMGCYGGLFWWELGATNATTLKAGNLAVTGLFFDDDGGLLHVGGWNELGEVWDTRVLRPILEGGVGRLVQLSRDQQRLATHIEKVGYGVREYLPPLGLRSWSAPPLLGKPRPSADVDPQERWLLMAFKGGWLIRDAESGGELARVPCADTLAASFAADGSNVLAWTRSGLRRWPFAPAPGPGTLAVGAPEAVWSPAGGTLDFAIFAARRRHTACSQAGRVTVLDLDHPEEPVQFALRLAGDNCHDLSPDGRWLLTGHHNQAGLDLYDAVAGRHVRRLAAETLADSAFDPYAGRLFTCTAAEHCEWNPETGELKRKTPWRAPTPNQGFIGFAPDGRLALAKVSPSVFQLHDLQAGRDFATLDFRDSVETFACHWSRDGRRLFFFGNDGSVTRVDLAVLRRELDRLGLNWFDDDPSGDFPRLVAGVGLGAARARSSDAPRSQPPAWRNPPRLAWFVSAGLLATIAIGHYILRYQRRLFARYWATETLAERRADELRDTHAVLAHSEKMRALGTMAAGVAHDFNNLLSVIRLANELIEEQTQPHGVTKENFASIQQAVQRGRGIVNSMLGYARDDGQARPFAPGALISDAVALLSKPFLSGLVLQIEVDPATPGLVGRRGRVEQMLLNLIVNASEAMGGRGTLRLGARPVHKTHGAVLPPRAAAIYVELSVADSGPGIAPDILPRIFEPFFTTKNQGAQHGTGLGLSMLYTMAKEDGIGVAVDSETGRGATFRLLLPGDGIAPFLQPAEALSKPWSSRREGAQIPGESEPPRPGRCVPEIPAKPPPPAEAGDTGPPAITGRDSPIESSPDLPHRQS